MQLKTAETDVLIIGLLPDSFISSQQLIRPKLGPKKPDERRVLTGGVKVKAICRYL